MTSTTPLRQVKRFTFVMVAFAAIALFSTNQANAQLTIGRGIAAGSFTSGYGYGSPYSSGYSGFNYVGSPRLATPRTSSVHTSYPRTSALRTVTPRTTPIYGGAYGLGYRGY